MLLKYSFVCDAANIAQSGKLNVLGIFRALKVRELPFILPKFTYIANIEFQRSEMGKHKFRLEFTDMNGQEAVKPLRGEINVQNLWINIMLEYVNVKFLKAGPYQLDLYIDELLTGTNMMEVVDKSA